MRLSTSILVIICCQAVALFNVGYAFVVSKSSIQRAAFLSEGRERALRADITDQLERIVDGPVVDLRGGKTTRKKGKESSTSAAKGKSSKTSKSMKKGPKKPSFVTTIKAFFQSLINPNFVLKLKAKKEKHNTVHGSGSA
ncbi:unnamed protein product [Pylaiella littoralis]